MPGWITLGQVIVGVGALLNFIGFIFGALAAGPHQVGALLRKPFERHWRARRGEYRIRYRIDEETQIVYVLDVDHRRDVYRS